MRYVALLILVLFLAGCSLLACIGRRNEWDRPTGVTPVLSRRSLALIRVQAMLAKAETN